LIQVTLSSFELLKLDPKNIVLGHEIRHAINHLFGNRHIGSAEAELGSYLPMGGEFIYGKYQSLEEAETYSYSIRESAKELLKLIKMNKYSNSKHLELYLQKLILIGFKIARRNKIIIDDLLDESKMEFRIYEFDNKRISQYGDSRKVLRYQLYYEENYYHYEFTVYDKDIKSTKEIRLYVANRIKEISEYLIPNYITQFSVAKETIALLLKAKSNREKASILDGLISITRPHFWDEENFVDLTKSDLVVRFNTVVQDRWARYSYLDE